MSTCRETPHYFDCDWQAEAFFQKFLGRPDIVAMPPRQIVPLNPEAKVQWVVYITTWSLD